MVKVFLYGVMSENNFGGPSLLHGVREIVKGLHEHYEIICYQRTSVIDATVSDMGFPVLQIPYEKMWPMLIDGLKLKCGIRPAPKDRALFWHHLKSSDIVANLFGICFCGDFIGGNYTYLKSVKSVAGPFLISLMARLYGKKTVKCTASYGPIKSKRHLVAARFAAKHIFTVMCAREHESEKQMREVACIKKPIPVAPDMANLMPCVTPNDRDVHLIGVSVSFQVIKHWRSETDYVRCIATLIRHIVEDPDRKDHRVVLIPNEIRPSTAYHDRHVAADIHKHLNHHGNVSVLDVSRITSSQLKNEIGRCELLIASRYHACVASLSAGVPTLVIGWHHKYGELMDLYGQGCWILPVNDCSESSLIAKFDELWRVRNVERESISSHYETVYKQVMQSGEIMFTKENVVSK